MILVDKLKQDFYNKLASTGSFDESFTKAVWTAYLKGIEDGVEAEAARHRTEQPDADNDPTT
jgi:hypothetical protein